MPDWMKHKLKSKSAGRNINNLKYADDITQMAEREEELKSLFFFFFLIVLFIKHTACGILVPQPGIEPMLPPLGAQSP